MCRARLVELVVFGLKQAWACVFGAAIYADFFTHRYLPDARWVLLADMIILYGRCVMTFRTHHRAPWRRMPVLAAFLGVAMLLWIAENVGTAAGAWIYPHQQAGWHLVPPSKYVSWLLLMMVSVGLVTLVHRPRPA